MIAWGAPQEIIDRVEAEEAEEAAAGFEVWEDCWPTVSVWMDLQTQWRRTGMSGVRYGLDYQVIPMVLAFHPDIPAEEHPEIFTGLRIMEDEALQAWSEKDP